MEKIIKISFSLVCSRYQLVFILLKYHHLLIGVTGTEVSSDTHPPPNYLAWGLQRKDWTPRATLHTESSGASMETAPVRS